MAGRLQWWMRGGATPELPRFMATVEAAEADRLQDWAAHPQGRLTLIVMLDQFTRGLFAGTPRAFASDPLALALAEEGVRTGAYDALGTAWERTFYELPFGHAEGAEHLRRLDFMIDAAEARVGAAPPHLKRLFEFAVTQPQGHREVIARFGRYPHRNAILGRTSTAEELAYLAEGVLVHERTPAPDTPA